MNHYKKALWYFSTAMVLGGIVFFGISMRAQSANLRIEPSGGSFQINSTPQFRAFSGEQDVTDQTSWTISGAFTNDPLRGEIIAPGQFRLLFGGTDVYVQARYQGVRAAVPLNVQGAIVNSGFVVNANKNNIKKGEAVTAKAWYREGRTCPTRQCPDSFGDVTSQATWSVSDPSILQMVAPGIFRAVAEAGTATITASFQGFSQSFDVLVTTTARGQYQVSLVKTEPIFGARQVDVNHHQNSDHFGGILSLKGTDGQRYFVAGGYCSMQYDNWGMGGMYAFTDDGQYIGKRDACLDATNGSPPRVCKHDTGCHAHFEMIDIGDGAFVREIGFSKDRGRPWITYKVSKSGIDLIDRLFVARQGRSAPEVKAGDILGASDIAYANGILIDSESMQEGPQRISDPGYPVTGQVLERYGTTNRLYALPVIREVAELRNDGPFPCQAQNCSGQPPLYTQKYTPIVGVGQYFLARDPKNTFSGVLVYRMPERGALFSNKEPELVQTIDGWLRAYSVDATDGKRIVLSFYDSHSSPRATRIYKAGDQGLVLETELSGGPSIFNEVDPATQISLSGDYLAYAYCPGNVSCELVVLKKGAKLTVEPLPRNEYAERQWIQAVEVSPTGNVMVATRDSGATDVPSQFSSGRFAQYIYLYKITGAAPSAPTPTSTSQTTFTSGTGGSSFGSAIQRQLDQIIDALRKLGITVPTSTPAR